MDSPTVRASVVAVQGKLLPVGHDELDVVLRRFTRGIWRTEEKVWRLICPSPHLPLVFIYRSGSLKFRSTNESPTPSSFHLRSASSRGSRENVSRKVLLTHTGRTSLIEIYTFSQFLWLPQLDGVVGSQRLPLRAFLTSLVIPAEPRVYSFTSCLLIFQRLPRWR